MHDLVSGVKAVSQGAESIGQGEWYRKHGMGSHLFPGEDDLSMAPEDTSAGVHVFWSASCAALAHVMVQRLAVGMLQVETRMLLRSSTRHV